MTDAVSSRLRRRVVRDFPDPETAAEGIRLVGGASNSERIQAAIVFAADGNQRWIQDGVELAALDYRDVLVNGRLAGGDWVVQLDRQLGP